jgi:Rrf2 family protein
MIMKIAFSRQPKSAALISKTAEYALRAVLFIARQSDEGPVRANVLAKALVVPSNYLSKILHTLARAGLLTSGRGPRGGFQLAKPPEEVLLADILEALDPSLLRDDCLLGNPRCNDEEPCAVHHRWKELRDPICEFFRGTTVASVMEGRPGPVSSVDT